MVSGGSFGQAPHGPAVFREAKVKPAVELGCLQWVQMDNSTAEIMLLHVGSEKIGAGMLQAGFFFFFPVLSAFTGHGLALK